FFRAPFHDRHGGLGRGVGRLPHVRSLSAGGEATPAPLPPGGARRTRRGLLPLLRPAGLARVPADLLRVPGEGVLRSGRSIRLRGPAWQPPPELRSERG